MSCLYVLWDVIDDAICRKVNGSDTCAFAELFATFRLRCVETTKAWIAYDEAAEKTDDDLMYQLGWKMNFLWTCVSNPIVLSPCFTPLLTYLLEGDGPSSLGSILSPSASKA